MHVLNETFKWITLKAVRNKLQLVLFISSFFFDNHELLFFTELSTQNPEQTKSIHFHLPRTENDVISELNNISNCRKSKFECVSNLEQVTVD